MRFMVIVHTGDMDGYDAGKMPDAKMLNEMGAFNEELIKAGVILDGGGLHPPSKSVRIHFDGAGKPNRQENAFASNAESACGYWIWNVASKEEAVAWAKRAPMEPNAVLELRQLFEMADFA